MPCFGSEVPRVWGGLSCCDIHSFTHSSTAFLVRLSGFSHSQRLMSLLMSLNWSNR